MARRPRVAAAVLSTVVLAGALTSCTNGSQTGAVTGSSGSAASASHPAAQVRSPLTGKPVTPDRPVLAVKIDNVSPARPQTGLSSADVVYVEPVEGGLSRILAVFSSRLPDRTGPVRSARESDLELLAEYGKPGLAFSGANSGVLAAVRQASVVDLSQDRVPAAYHRSSSRSAPHNLYVEPKVLIRGHRDLSAARDVGFEFGAAPADGTPTTRQQVRYGAASTAFAWSATHKSWTVLLDGQVATSTDGGRVAASTVVVQYVQVTKSGYHDTLGNPTPFTHTVGSGTALVLRDGQKFAARWSRPTADQPTRFTTPAGASLPFAAGPIWVVYAGSRP